MGNFQNIMLVILVLAVLGIAGTTVWYFGFRAPIPVEETILPGATPPATPTGAIECLSTTTPQVTFNCLDLANKGTAVTADVVYRVGGGGIQVADCDTAINFNSGQKVEFLINKSSWYTLHSDATSVLLSDASDIVPAITLLNPEKQILLSTDKKNGEIVGNQYIVPCEEKATVGVYLKGLATTATMQLYSEDDNLLVSYTNTESIVASENPKIQGKILGQVDKYIQDPMIIAQYSKTYFDVKDFAINNYLATGTPTHTSIYNTTKDNADRAWLVSDYKNIKPGDIVPLLITMDATTTDPIDPNHPIFFIDDADWFIDEKDGTFKYGRDDENGADVGLGQQVNATLWIA